MKHFQDPMAPPLTEFLKMKEKLKYVGVTKKIIFEDSVLKFRAFIFQKSKQTSRSIYKTDQVSTWRVLILLCKWQKFEKITVPESWLLLLIIKASSKKSGCPKKKHMFPHVPAEQNDWSQRPWKRKLGLQNVASVSCLV